MKRVDILGVPIDALTCAQAIKRLRVFLDTNEKKHVMTPNSEMVVEAQRNSAFKSLLQKTDLNLADSAGLLWAAKRTGQYLPERVTGVDTVEQLLLQLDEKTPVFFLGGRKGVGCRAAEILKKKNPQLLVAGCFEGSPSDADAAEIIQKINDSGAHLLLVAFGAPTQDLWINQYLLNLPSVRVAIGVGGTFDFLSGAIKRAPKWMQSLHLEWLWRLILQPSRIKRIWTATVTFPLIVLRT